MTKSAHIQEIVKHRESWLQAIWAHQLFSKKALFTTESTPIEILFPGWLNKGAGPDFHDARIVIGDTEYQGAVEIHLQSSGWYSHKHHENPLYNSVILHVVLDQNSPRPINREDKMPIPQVELRPLLDSNALSLLAEEKEMLDRYDRLPGRCGLMVSRWGIEPLKQLLGHAAENRMQRKVDRIQDQWDQHPPEQLLFQLIFKTLGYSAYSHVFEELAQLYPLSILNQLLQQPYRVARTAIIGRWFGACGLFSNSSPSLAHPTLRKEYHQWREEWSQQPNQKRVSEKFAKTSRPQNSPERRLIGMFHHLYHLNSQGLLKGWLSLLKDLEKIATEKALKKQALQQTKILFSTPEWEEWQSYYGISLSQNKKSAQLIGKDRQIIVMANAIIPFFLAYARHENWAELEKLLYRLFISLPPEASNHRIRFMEKRLLPFPTTQLHPKTLRAQQGLLQIHQDFCQSFEQGCARCQLIHFLEQFHRELQES